MLLHVLSVIVNKAVLAHSDGEALPEAIKAERL
jgi:hypothetical protein